MDKKKSKTDSRIILEICTPTINNPIIESNLILDILHDSLLKNEMDFEYKISKESITLIFENINSYKRFHRELLPNIPYENKKDDPNQEPDELFKVTVRFLQIPKEHTLEEITQISMQSYKDMKIPVIHETISDSYEIQFSSFEAYFAVFLNVFGNLENMILTN